MPASTPDLAIPYPLPGDAMIDYPTTGRELAERIEALGGLTLLWDSIDAGAVLPAASITTPSLEQAFKHLLIFWAARSTYGGPVDDVGLRLNQNASASYYRQWLSANGAVVGAASAAAATGILVGEMAGGAARPEGFGGGLVFAGNYADGSAAVFKPIIALGAAIGSIVDGQNYLLFAAGFFGNANPIVDLTFYSINGGSFAPGSRFSVYGVG